jgi:hypothetical protein
MLIETRGVQILAFCDARQPADAGSLVDFLGPPRHAKDAAELASQRAAEDANVM